MRVKGSLFARESCASALFFETALETSERAGRVFDAEPEDAWDTARRKRASAGEYENKRLARVGGVRGRASQRLYFIWRNLA